MEPCGGRFRTQLNMTLVSHPRQVMLSIGQTPHKIELNWYPQNWFSFQLLLGNERDELYIVYPYISFHNYTYSYQENKSAKKNKPQPHPRFSNIDAIFAVVTSNHLQDRVWKCWNLILNISYENEIILVDKHIYKMIINKSSIEFDHNS